MNRRADLSVDFGGNFGFERFIEAAAFEIIRRAFFRFADVGAAPRSFAGKIQRDFTGRTFSDAQKLGFMANFPAAHAAAHFNLFNRGHFLFRCRLRAHFLQPVHWKLVRWVQPARKDL